MNPIAEKRSAWASAKELLARDDEDSLRFAALELRRCLEAIVYEKLWAYKDRIPGKAARTWQPPQAFKALVLFEPDAEHTRTIRFAEESRPGEKADGPFIELGTDYRFKAKWLTTEYNKLGSLLHASWPFSEKNTSGSSWVRPYLAQLTSDLERFVSRSFTSTLAQTVTFACAYCDSEMTINEKALENLSTIECINCGAKHAATHQGADVYFQLQASSLQCKRCGEQVVFPEHRIQVGFVVRCAHCLAEYRITGQTFDVELLHESSSQKPVA